MIQILHGGTIYLATLLGCYDGDTCTISFHMSAPDFITEKKIRFIDFDTPEINGKCPRERILAKRARAITQDYMRAHPTLKTDGRHGKYGRLLVAAPELKERLFRAGVARPYGSKISFCAPEK